MKFLGINEFKSAVKDGSALPTETGVRLHFVAEVKEVSETQSEFVITTEAVDRHGDRVMADGGEFANFLKNPVVLFAHDYDSPPVAKCVALTRSGKQTSATVEWPTRGVYPFADTVHDMVKAGFLNATSIGFVPLDYEHPGKEEASNDGRSEWDYNFTKWDLLEFSIVPVPANPEAIVISRSLIERSIKSVTEVPVAIKDSDGDNDGSITKRMKAVEDRLDAHDDKHDATDGMLGDHGKRIGELEDRVGKSAPAPVAASAATVDEDEISDAEAKELIDGAMKLFDDFAMKATGQVAE